MPHSLVKRGEERACALESCSVAFFNTEYEKSEYLKNSMVSKNSFGVLGFS